MSLIPGTRLGVYDITALIGEGGMGQVFRATDTRLKRQVAIKILPPSVAADADRLARFQREAEVLASLNHPHIAAIYGLEESGGVTALVMELVEGDDLSQRISRGAIPLDEALPIAKQIAEALEAAHEQGIIHRDLKPANIKVRSDGTVKVLDFGLAKAMEPAAGSSPSMSMSPTITTPAVTQAGMILGTAAYMSPEQAKGRAVDRRGDVWAFGAVLYEMLTGQRVFAGEDVSDTLANVQKTEPDWERLHADVPARVRQVIRACLQKNAKQRIGDVQDVRLALEGAFETTVPQTAAMAPSSTLRGRLAWMVAAVAVLAAVGLAVPALRRLRETPPLPPPETRLDIVTPATNEPTLFALSPDGRQIVFMASGDGRSRLWLRSLAASAAQPLPGTEGAAGPFWSPDSRSVGFFAEAKLKRLDIGGGAPQTLAAAASARGGTWNADGIILFTPNAGGAPLFRVPASGGKAVALTTLDRQSSHRFPFFLPDGRHFLFLAIGTPDTAGIYLGALDSPSTRRLTPAEAAGVYLPSGWLLWVREGTLVAQHLDLERQVLTGGPVTVADAVAVNAASVRAVSVSATGLVAYRTGAASRRQLTWFNRVGQALGTLGAPDEAGLNAPRVSPDGSRVAVYRTAGNADIWLLDATHTSRFTFDAAQENNPVWSPDGRWIVFDSNRKGPRNLYQKDATGTGAEELLVESAQGLIANDWSADGRFLLYHSVDPQDGYDLWVRPMHGDRTPWVFLKTRFDERFGQFSRDGRFVAYMSSESGRNEIYIRPFAPPVASSARSSPAAGQWQVSTGGGGFPRWRRDGRELYYLGPAGEFMAAPIAVAGTTLTPGAPVTLFPTRISGDSTGGPQYDVAPDGRFLINTVLDDASAPITLLMNWRPEAKK